MLYINMLSHGSEGKHLFVMTNFMLHIRVISRGSEGMDMWSTAHFHMVVKEVGWSKKDKRRKMHYDY